MKDKYKISAVSYLNTKPFLYGIFNHSINENLNIDLAIPSACAVLLLEDRVDFGLVPVAILKDMPQAYILSDYCIGAEGKVKTVCIYSEVPIEEVECLYLDYHSKTSVQLAQILCQHHWKIAPQYLEATEGFISNIKSNTAAVVIGDRCIELEGKYPYVYDLGEHWKNMTGLPFVFAAWISKKPLPNDFIDAFNEALKGGLESIPQLVKLLPDNSSQFDLETYFKQYISYELTADKQKALRLFLKYLKVEKEPIFLNGSPAPCLK